MAEHAVVIAGGGPTGLMLAGELALAGVDVAIVERRANQDLAGSRAGGLHPRTIEVLDRRGRVVRRAGEPTLRDVSEALIAVYGTDFWSHSPTWISRFTDMTRQTAAYRDRRVLLAGDAAHVHSVDRRHIRGHVGASGNRGGHGSHRRVGSARRICSLGGRPDSGGAR